MHVHSWKKNHNEAGTDDQRRGDSYRTQGLGSPCDWFKGRFAECAGDTVAADETVVPDRRSAWSLFSALRAQDAQQDCQLLTSWSDSDRFHLLDVFCFSLGKFNKMILRQEQNGSIFYFSSCFSNVYVLQNICLRNGRNSFQWQWRRGNSMSTEILWLLEKLTDVCLLEKITLMYVCWRS